MKKRLKVINLFGGPGTGKSTSASFLFGLMKVAEMEVELVTEYAKYLVWAERANMFRDQSYIFAKQNHKLEILIDKVEWVITDSPLLLSTVYAGKEFSLSFRTHVFDMYNKYENINIFLNRVKKYNPNGRNQTESEADEISIVVKNMLETHAIPYVELDATPTVAWDIYKVVTGKDHILSVPQLLGA